MNCIEVAKSLQLFLDEELPFHEVEPLELHFAGCSVCNERLKSEKIFRQTLKEKISRKTATDTILDHVKTAIHAHEVV